MCHGKARSAIATGPVGAKARGVCTPWAGMQPCRRGQRSVPQQQGQPAQHPRPSPGMGAGDKRLEEASCVNSSLDSTSR